MDPFLGEIRLVGFNFAPRGWALCAGQILPISQYTALFSLLGTNYGGDGRVTFALPNLQAKVPIHAGQGIGLSTYVLGEEDGSDTVTLATNELPAHTHQMQAMSIGATSNNPTGAMLAIPQQNDRIDDRYSTAAPDAVAADCVLGAGQDSAHNNMQPYLVLNYIIAVEGIFPPR